MGIDIPKIEVRYEHLSIEGDAYVGSRALPTLLNVTLNLIEVIGLFLMMNLTKYELVIEIKLHILFMMLFIYADYD